MLVFLNQPRRAMQTLQGKIALVTGASRGAGRGIALALGEAGATVYVTGRSVHAEHTAEGLPGTVQETANAVTARGGRGHAVACDHTDDAQVAALFAQVRDEKNRLDVLVNNVWGGYEQYDLAAFGAPFWEQPLDKRWRGMFEAGVQAHLRTSQHAAPLMIAQQRGLIVNTTVWDHAKYLGNALYDVAKAAVNRMAFAMAQDLRPHGVAALAVAPGFMRTERVLAALGGNLERAAAEGALVPNESPEYVGRAIVALASDPAIMERTGQTFRVGDLAPVYGFTDTDGTQPPPFDL